MGGYYQSLIQKTNMKELLQNIGKEAEIFIGGLNVLVKIDDVKKSYGHDRFLVTPIAGRGSVWVEAVSLVNE